MLPMPDSTRLSTILRAAVASALLTLTLGCASSPTAPRSLDLTGRWVGELPLHLPDEDWSFALVQLLQIGDAITGTMTSRDGVARPVSGAMGKDRALLDVGGLPGTSTCASIQLSVVPLLGGPQIERLVGVALGRCYGTVSGQFTLARVN
jgi:hypothetical protein